MKVDAVAVIDAPLTGRSSIVVRGKFVDRVRDLVAGWCDLGGDLRSAVLIVHPGMSQKLTGVASEHRLVMLCGLPVCTDLECPPGEVRIEAMS